MIRLHAALRCSTTLVALALVTAPVAFAPVLFGSDSALAQTPTEDSRGNTNTTVPDATYGPGGAKESVSGRDYRLTRETLKDSSSKTREETRFDRNGVETRDFWDAQARLVGTIKLTPVNGTWQMTVTGSSADADTGLDSKTAQTKEAFENDIIYWQNQMRFWSSGQAGPVPAPGTPGFGSADPGGALPGVGYAVGTTRPQTGGLTIQCFGDLACERALAAGRGETNFDYGKGAEKDRERDDRKDRPLYERPDLPRPGLPPNGLRYDMPPPPPP